MNRIMQLRKEAGLSQKELAEKTGVNQTAVSQWETGKTSPGSGATSSLCTLFDVSFEYLLGQSDKRNHFNVPDSENPYAIFKTPKFVLMYWLEALGYKVGADEAEGYLWITDIVNNLDYEIADVQLKDLEKSIGDYTKFSVYELLKNCRSLPSQYEGGENNAEKEIK